MIREAELFRQTELVLVEVLGRIRPDDWRIVVPAWFDPPAASEPRTIRQHVTAYVAQQSQVADVLAGKTPGEGDGPTDEPQAAVKRVSAEACAAVAEVDDALSPVHSGPVGDYLLALSIDHCFLAQYVAMYLGSTACPFTEDLGRGMWEATAPDAASWRARGLFREPLPLPADVSWRDRFLRTAGHDPHPLDH